MFYKVILVVLLLVIVLFATLSSNFGLRISNVGFNSNPTLEKDAIYQAGDIRVYQFWHRVNGGDINCYLAKDSHGIGGLYCLQTF